MTEFLKRISQPFAGITNISAPVWKKELTGTDLHLYICGLPNLTFSYDGITNWNGDSLREAGLSGAGVSIDPHIAQLKSVAEAAERYATSVLLDSEVILSDFSSISNEAIDMSPIADCAREEAGRGFAQPFDERSHIRWVKGWCLLENREKYVPAVMTHLFPRPNANENFWLPISTGVAAHTSLLTASISAICELIERDAISLNWLTKRKLKRVDVGSLKSEYVLEAGRSDTIFHFFDATTDIGIPTMYGIEEHSSDESVANVVACCTDFNWKEGIDGIIRELCSTRTAIKHSPTPPPESFEACLELEHGAKMLGQSSFKECFDFLKNQEFNAEVTNYEHLSSLEQNEKLQYLIDKVAKVSNDLVLVDLTTDDLRECGLFVIRAIAPGLVPMSTHYIYRYLGHPRIRSFVEEFLQLDMNEVELNPLPQPFA